MGVEVTIVPQLATRSQPDADSIEVDLQGLLHLVSKGEKIATFAPGMWVCAAITDDTSAVVKR